MARAGTSRNRASQSTPYDRARTVRTEREPTRSLFGRLRDFLWGSRNGEHDPDQTSSNDTTYNDSVARVPVIIDEEPSEFMERRLSTGASYRQAVNQDSAQGFQSTPRRPAHNLQPPVMSTPFKDPHLSSSTPANWSFNASPAPLGTASPNEALLEFFKAKGDQELSNMEVVGVLSLIGQAVSRNESLVDFSTIHHNEGSNVSYDMPSTILSGHTTVTPNGSLTNAVQASSFRTSSPSTSRTWSARRRGLASGPKLSRSRPTTPYARSPRQTAPQTSQPTLPRTMSNTASTLLEILDEPKSNRQAAPSGQSPRKPSDTSTAQFPSSIEDSYTKYRPTKSSGLRNSLLPDEPEAAPKQKTQPEPVPATLSVPKPFGKSDFSNTEQPKKADQPKKTEQPKANVFKDEPPKTNLFKAPEPTANLSSATKPASFAPKLAASANPGVFSVKPVTPTPEQVVDLVEPIENKKPVEEVKSERPKQVKVAEQEVAKPQGAPAKRTAFAPVTAPVATSVPSTDTIPDFSFDPLPESGEPLDLTPAEQAQVREMETSFTF